MLNKRIVLAARPSGEPRESDFQLVEGDIETMASGDVLVEVLWVSVDPYMRGRMNDAKSYIEPFQIGQTIQAGAVGRVLRSNSKDFADGDFVEGMLGWQTCALASAKNLRKLDASLAPVETALGVLGMPGMTAYFGFLDICQPKPGKTVVVSGAAGAVGSYVGQIARIKGCRVIGIAGGPAKCDVLKNEFGFDAAIDYKNSNVASELRALCPKGIDCYFDNVGGAITDAVFPQLATFARVSVCGQISQYNNTAIETGPRLLSYVLVKQARVEGFIVTRYMSRAKEFFADMVPWVREGRIKYRQTVVDGIENAPRAFIGMLRGENTGKMLVKVAR